MLSYKFLMSFEPFLILLTDYSSLFIFYYVEFGRNFIHKSRRVPSVFGNILWDFDFQSSWLDEPFYFSEKEFNELLPFRFFCSGGRRKFVGLLEQASHVLVAHSNNSHIISDEVSWKICRGDCYRFQNLLCDFFYLQYLYL